MTLAGEAVAGEVLPVRRSFMRLTAHAVGNLLLGLSVGLAVYYGVTDIAARLDQTRLAQGLPGPAGSGDPVLVGDEPFDLEGWEEQDAAYWTGLADGEVFGRLVAASIGVDVFVVKGHGRPELKRGPGWIAYTDLPGPVGNCGIAGHRTTYGGPFRRIDELEQGDTIDLYSPYRRYRYIVTEKVRVTPDRVDVMDSTEDPRLTLSACDPPYSAQYRLIVHADLTGVARIATDR